MLAWRHTLIGLGLALVLGGCAAEPTPVPTPLPPTPTAVPKRPEDSAGAFFTAWQQGQYSAMYDLLASEAQTATSRDVFVRRYTNIHNGIGELRLSIQQGSMVVADDGQTAELPFQVTRGLAVFGDLAEDNTLPLIKEQGLWKVAWQHKLIFAGLTANSSVLFTPDVPLRGRIVDRSGKPLAENGSILAVGVVPGEITDEAALLKALSEALDLSPEVVKRRYQGGQPTWFMPIAERPGADRAELEGRLGAVPGVSLQDRPARVYPLGPAAAHVIGYVGHPTADELRQLGASGFEESDWIGHAGVEAWGERQLAGTRGGAIQIVDQGRRVLRNVVRKASEPGQDIKLSLDSAIQQQATRTLDDKTGSVVVLDPRDNSVLALASLPSFDPNQFVLGLSDGQWQQLNGPERPLVLRATESSYPTGSIFKVVTMAAGMDNGVARTSDTFDCGSNWNGLPGVTLHNWQPQGTLRLVEALAQSCNPAFYEIGLKLDKLDPTILPAFARTFGFGQVTRTVGVHEVPGTVPDPTWKRQQVGEAWSAGDSVYLAIGQGYLLATPLQVANAYAALARGGTLLAPRLVSGENQEQLGSLNLSPDALRAILDGMKRVTSTPAGTAYYAFRDERIPTAAKTGSAENESPDAHAWFAGFAAADKPSLLVLVMIEGGQHGGTVAAPLARSIVDFAFPLTR